MDVLITQKKMTDSEAFVKARGGGNSGEEENPLG